MVNNKRSMLDRRSGEDRRVAYNLDYFRAGGKERRSMKERRSQPERRRNWIKLSKWSSANLRDLKIAKLLR